jgi:TonB family protein
VKVTVAPDGSVSEAKVLTSSVGSSTVDACVLGRFRQMQLPDPARTQPAGFTYVLEFSGEM